MIVPRPEVLTRIRQAKGKHGDPAGAPSEVDIPGCVVWPQDGNASSSNEKTDGQDTVIIGYAALVPPGTDVLATDQLRWRGQPFDVVGEPAIFTTPFTSTDPGIQISMRRVTG